MRQRHTVVGRVVTVGLVVVALMASATAVAAGESEPPVVPPVAPTSPNAPTAPIGPEPAADDSSSPDLDPADDGLPSARAVDRDAVVARTQPSTRPQEAVDAGPTESDPVPGSIEIVEDATPDDPTDFDFSICPSDLVGGCTSSPTTFTLDDDDDATLATSHVASLAPGVYTVRQAVAVGWTLTSIVCANGESVDLGRGRVVIELDPAEAQRCVFSDRQASIRVTQDAAPFGAQDFEFEACLVGAVEEPCQMLTLDDDGDATRSSTGSFDGLEPGIYTVEQADVPTYGLSALTCTVGSADLANRRVTVTITPGEQVACTFTNRPTTLAIHVNASPLVQQSFRFSVCPEGGQCTEADLSDGGSSDHVSLRPIEPGTYTIEQDAVPGWAMERITCDTGDVIDLDGRRATVQLAQGETTTCVFVNRSPSIRVNLTTKPESPQDVPVSICREGDPCHDITLDDDDDDDYTNSATAQLVAIDPGEWTIQFPEIPGWGLTALSCNSGEEDLSSRRATFTLGAMEDVTCDVEYTETSLTILHNTSADSGQDFTYTGCAVPESGVGVIGCSEFFLDDDADPTLVNDFIRGGLAPGTYTITQAGVPGYGLTRLSCSSGTTDLARATATLVIRAGDLVTCSFTSTSTSLTITQDTAPNAAQDFEFVGCAGPSGTQGCGPFTLDDDADPALPSSVTYRGLTAGTVYTVEQSAVAGYGLTGLTCSNGLVDLAARRFTVVLRPGEQVTCTYTDRVTSLRIVQDTSPNSGQDFTFTGCSGPGGAGGCGTFSFDDDSDGTLPASDTFSGLASGELYTITQEEVQGYGLSSITCSGGPADVDVAARRVALQLAPGDQVTCMFTDVVTSLTIVQNSVPENAQDFTFRSCASPDSCTEALLDDDGAAGLPTTASLPVTAGRSYVVSQDAVVGHHLTALTCSKGVVDLSARRATVTLQPGDKVTCTFTVQAASLTIIQDTAPNGPQDFAFTGCAGPGGSGGCGSFALDDDADAALSRTAVFLGVAPGTEYSLVQDAVPGFGLTALSCSNGQVDLAARRVSLALAPGEQVTCTFTVRATSVTIVQDTAPNGSQDMVFTGCAGPGGSGGCGPFALDDDADPTLPSTVTFDGLVAGTTYTLTQEVPAGFGLTRISCTNGVVDLQGRRATLTPEPGDQVTCTFTTVETSLTIVHDLVNDGAQPFAFTACRGTDPCTEFTLADPGNGGSTAPWVLRSPDATTYTVTQTAVPGYDLSGLTCTQGEAYRDEASVVVPLVPGRQAICTFQSWANRLAVSLDAVPNAPQDFGFTMCGPAGCTNHVVDDDNTDSTRSGRFHLPAAIAGEYTITQEDLPSGWGLNRIYCYGHEIEVDLSLRRVTLDLADGDQTNCLFENRQTAITVVADTVADAPRNVSFSFCPVVGSPCTAFQLDDDANATLSNTRTFGLLEPGTYTVTQDAVDEAVVTSLSCGPGASTDLAARRATVTVVAGQQTTCTFVNRTPSITVAHDAVPNSGIDFSYRFCQVSNGACSNLILDDDTNASRSQTATFADLAPGTYTVTRTALNGWTLTAVACTTGESTDVATGTAVVTLVAGESTTCTFTVTAT